MPRDQDERREFESAGEALGGIGGKMARRATDAALNAAESLLTSAFQAIGDWWASAAAEEAPRATGDPEERAYRDYGYTYRAPDASEPGSPS